MNVLSVHASLSSSREKRVLNLLRDLISDYVDLQGTTVERSTELVAIGVNPITAAEIVFALEDRLGISFGQLPKMLDTVGALVDCALAAYERRAGDPFRRTSEGI